MRRLPYRVDDGVRGLLLQDGLFFHAVLVLGLDFGFVLKRQVKLWIFGTQGFITSKRLLLNHFVINFYHSSLT